MITDHSPNALNPYPADDALHATAERRQSTRHTSILKAAGVSGEIKRFKPAWLARVMDISIGGIALHLGERFDVDTVLTISLHDSTGQRVTKLEVTVRHAAEQPNGTWILGAAFREPLSDLQLADLLR